MFQAVSRVDRGAALPLRGQAVRNLVVGVEIGTESLRLAIVDADEGSVLGTASEAHATSYPETGRCEQEPLDWWAGLARALESALLQADVPASLVSAICVATTSCTVVACMNDGTPLRPAIMWSDARAAMEAEDLLRLAENDPALIVNCGGKGPVSAEWMIPKSMWIKWHEPMVWEKAAVVCEAQDWINFKLSGCWVASSCNVATRWHCDGVLAVKRPSSDGTFGGRPRSLLRALDLEDLGEKWPRKCVALGSIVGGLTADAQAHLGLPEHCVVVQGGADALIALVAAAPEGGCLVVTGASHMHLVSGPIEEGATLTGASGAWGPYRGAPLPTQMMVEGGQTSTGSVLRWAQQRLFTESTDIAQLDAEAHELPIGSEGLAALETFQGSRTPMTDLHARGCLIGLSLAHTRAHIWRAFLEAIVLGTRASLRALNEIMPLPPRVFFCGVATKSKFFTQMHADAANVSVAYYRTPANLVVTGAAALAAAAVTSSSIAHMAAVFLRDCDVRTVAPQPSYVAQFDQLYERLYSKLAHALSPLVPRAKRSRLDIAVSASVLAADVGALRDDAISAYVSGAWLHVDVLDGSAVSRGTLSSLGPASVRSIRDALPDAVIEVHMASRDPALHIATFAEAGASRITFQREAIKSETEALTLAKQIRSFGCEVGVAIAPATPIADVEGLVAAKAVDLVDVLTADPGKVGQKFQTRILEKIRALRSKFPWLLIQVDGGIDEDTAPLACQAGADVLVAGTYIFPQHSHSYATRSSDIADAISVLRAVGSRM